MNSFVILCIWVMGTMGSRDWEQSQENKNGETGDVRPVQAGSGCNSRGNNIIEGLQWGDNKAIWQPSAPNDMDQPMEENVEVAEENPVDTCSK
jgi:hypothetical protein